MMRLNEVNRGPARGRIGTVTAAILAGTLLVSGVAISGCKKKEPPPPPPKEAPPPPPPQPVEIDAVMQAMKADARVQFPQAKAPTDENLARAVVEFASALAKGDAGQVQSMLDASAKTVLEQLRASGGWEEAVAKIQAVRVVQLAGSEAGGMLSLAVQEPGSAYVLNWMITGADGKFIFGGMPASSQVLARASDWDSANVMPSAGPAGLPKIDPAALIPGEEAPPPEGEAPAEDERNPRRRNTPGGPVDVPGAPPSTPPE
ncbi:MAG: hypothetical protein IT436_17660 [Phycisphaerales bacterium]|nr:hypothetical protein [Phycisphaerales bacterium]